jgi:tetratricopeptide (TPR) repeat protein
VLLIPIGLGGSVLGTHVWAEYHYRAAETALEQYRLREARQHLEACLRVWPRSAPTRLLAARAARQSGDFAAAEKHLKVADLYQGDLPDEVIELEQHLLRAQRGDSQQILTYCQSLVAADHPQTPLILEAMAQGFVRQFRLAEAQVCLRVWLDRQPDNPQGLYLRAWVWEQRNNYVEAAADYRHLLKLMPENKDARLRLASCLVNLSRPAEAARHLERLRRHHPKNPLVLVRLAKCRHELGKQDQAIKLLDAVLAHEPPYPPALAVRGELALRTGDSAGAERWLRKAVALSPIDYKTHYLLHQALVQAGKTREARALEKKLKALREDIDRVRNIIVRDMTVRPHDPNLHYHIGKVLLRGGDTREGLHWLRSALKEDPRHQPTHQLLADYYLKIGRVGQSLRHRRLARAGKAGPPPNVSGSGLGETKGR